MDPTSLLAAVLATAVYPGAAFLLVAAVLHRRLAGSPAGRRPAGPLAPGSLLPVVAAIVATAMLPLPGSPALHLPPPSGVAGNTVAVVVLLGVAVDLGAGSRRVRLLAALAALPLLALAAAAGTLSLAALSGASDGVVTASRILTAAVLVLAAASTAGGRAASVVAAALSLAAASLVLPAALGSAPPLLGALAALVVVASAALLGRRQHARWRTPLTGVGLAMSLAGVAAALLSARI